MAPPGQPPVRTPTAHTSTKNLLQQLPAGAVLAFQALAGTFTNSGKCHPSNQWLTGGLVIVLSATCVFFAFTDSLVYGGKVYYGVATPGRLNILNMPKKEEDVVFRNLKPELKKRGLKTVDWVHGFLSLVVFLTIAGSDVGLQNCFFPAATEDTRQWLRNLPLGMAVMTSFLFMIFPTTRKGIRLDNSSPPATEPEHKQEKKEDGTTGGNKPAAADRAITSTSSLLPMGPALPSTVQEKPDAADRAIPSMPSRLQLPPTVPALESEEGGSDYREKNKETEEARKKKPAAADMAITSTASLSQLLPTGPVLAFQTLAASFTNQGDCHHSNFWLTVGLVTFLGATCIFSAFTDCIPDPKTVGKVHKGVALPSTLHILGMSKKDQTKEFRRALKKRRLKTMDWVHAFFTAVVFLTIAGRDVGLQKCFFPDAGDDTRQLLTNLPLGVSVLSSFVFIIFPTTRKSMGFDDSDYIFVKEDDKKEDGKKEDDKKGAPPTPPAQPIDLEQQ